MILGLLLACGAPLDNRPPPRRGGVAVVTEGTLWTVGGWADGRLTDAVWAFDLRTRVWSRGPPAPVAMARGAALWRDGAALVLAGETEAGVSDRFYRFDPGTGDWSELAPLGEALRRPALAALEDEVYVLGGERADGSVSAATWTWDGGAWVGRTEQAALEGWRGFQAVDDDTGRVLLAGGDPGDANGGLGWVMVWDGADLGLAGPGPGPRDGACLLGDEGRLHLTGGLAGDDRSWTWTASEGWVAGEVGPAARREAYCATVADSLYVHGGDLGFNELGATPTGDLWRLTEGEWTEVLGPDGSPPD